MWIELLGLLHDSDNYGVLAWPLKEIAQALGAPVKALKELVDKGVLYGAEKGECEPFVYTPRSGRKNGEPVELVAVQQGPVWFSPRMVRDEYVRTVRGENTRFSEENNPQNPSPKGGLVHHHCLHLTPPLVMHQPHGKVTALHLLLHLHLLLQHLSVLP